mgnify:CR=1 FL=1
MSDLIERQVAIEKRSPQERLIIAKTLIESVLDDLPSAQPERCEDCGNFNKTRLLIPQPEIVRCGKCKHRDPEDKKCDCGHSILWQLPRDDDWFCADAERRTDG